MHTFCYYSDSTDLLSSDDSTSSIFSGSNLSSESDRTLIDLVSSSSDSSGDSWLWASSSDSEDQTSSGHDSDDSFYFVNNERVNDDDASTDYNPPICAQCSTINESNL